MNASPYFRYYAAFALILMLALLMQVQAHATPSAQPTEEVATSVSCVNLSKLIV
jgi:hypothetical protein